MTRYVFLVEGEEWLKQFENRARFKLRPWHVFFLGFVLAGAIGGGTWWIFG
jgi:hypothetical protein